MGRSWLIVGLVALFVATGVAAAAPGERLQVPAPMGLSDHVSLTDVVVVEPGDHLWSISVRHLAERSPELDVAPYWLEVVERNEPGLRSRDADLIYPGEVIEMPEISEQR